jgi:glutamyl-tRNA synthetase
MPDSIHHQSHPLLYRGRLAPSPTGYLHLGHARTFWIAQQRARERGGVLILRNEDLDFARCKPEFVNAMFGDLKWFGLTWQEGPDLGGPSAPYNQSQRIGLYRWAFESLQSKTRIYPCSCSRRDIANALTAPHPGDEEPLYPGTCRPPAGPMPAKPVHWRFRVPDGQPVEFLDQNLGPQRFVAGRDFGDFVVWRSEDLPSYQLAVVVDDAAMKITEVVRGEDLLLSTARQILLYDALGFRAPDFYHCPLLHDAKGARLAKRDGATSLQSYRARGANPATLRETW